MFNTIAVKLQLFAERHIKKEHPWIFENAIEKTNKTPNTGDVAIIFDQKKNKFLALGLFDMESPIRIKVVQAHQQFRLNRAWIADAVQEAYAKRKTLIAKKVTGFRLINGENDRFPTLVVDVYGEVVVVKYYSMIWKHFIDEIHQALIELLNPKALVVRTSRNATEQFRENTGWENGAVVYGSLEHPEVVFQEYDVLFKANVVNGHKTGYFIDHRENRHQVGQFSKGKSVLDVFSYAGGFSTHALVGGASEVVSVDISKQALLAASQNAELNGKAKYHKTICGDAFKVMEELIEHLNKFDVVVVDPPSFAKSQKEVAGALRSYQKLIHLAHQLVKPKGILVMASCSSRVKSEDFFQLIERQMREEGVTFECMDKTYHAIDHPTTFAEAAYLKCGYYRIY